MELKEYQKDKLDGLAKSIRIQNVVLDLYHVLDNSMINVVRNGEGFYSPQIPINCKVRDFEIYESNWDERAFQYNETVYPLDGYIYSINFRRWNRRV